MKNITEASLKAIEEKFAGLTKNEYEEILNIIDPLVILETIFLSNDIYCEHYYNIFYNIYGSENPNHVKPYFCPSDSDIFRGHPQYKIISEKQDKMLKIKKQFPSLLHVEDTKIADIIRAMTCEEQMAVLANVPYEMLFEALKNKLRCNDRVINYFKTVFEPNIILSDYEQSEDLQYIATIEVQLIMFKKCFDTFNEIPKWINAGVDYSNANPSDESFFKLYTLSTAAKNGIF